jgi:hypothetical protein
MRSVPRPPRWLGPIRISVPFARPKASQGTPISMPGAADTHTPGANGHEPSPPPDLYAVLGIAQDALDWEIQVAYRKRAAFLASGQAATREQLKELNAAYEVLGNPARRAEYERIRSAPQPLRPPSSNGSGPGLRRYPRFAHPHAVGRWSSGLAELFGILLVVAVSSLSAVYFIGRIAIDLSPISSMARLIGIGSPEGRAVLDTLPEVSTPSSDDASPTNVPPAASGQTPAAPASQSNEDVSAGSVPPAATATAVPVPLAEQFRGSTITVSNNRPRRFTPVNIVAKLRRNGQPAANVEVWATVQYRTERERWPPTGATRTDSRGTATFTLNVGNATPNYEVKAEVRARVDGQELSWPVSFTPR